MKNLFFTLFITTVLAISCSSENEIISEPESSPKEKLNIDINDAQEGVEALTNKIKVELADSSSTLNAVLDSAQSALSNSDDIIKDGVNALEKGLKELDGAF